MAYVVGQTIGGMFGIFILYILVEWAIFKRVFDDPIKGKLTSVFVAYLIGSLLAGFGRADGGTYYWGAFLDYAIPSVLVACFAFYAGKRLKEQSREQGVAEVFE